METLLQLSESEAPSTIVEVLQALRGQDLDPRHEAKTWGDWIHIDGFRTVISIESMRGLTRSATIEHGENDGLTLDVRPGTDRAAANRG